MAVSPVTGTANAAAASATSKTLASFAENFDNFLGLLTAQLKNQDPLSPMDATQFTTQLVQFTGVEQAILQNKNMEELVGQQKSAQVASSVGYIGKTVTTAGNQLALSGGTAELSYKLASPAKTCTVTITDANGQKVRVLTGKTGSGDQTLAWDGRNDAGVQMPDGVYNLSVKAVDAAGKSIAVTTGMKGEVTGVSVTDGVVTLVVNKSKIPLADLTSVSTD